MTQLDATLTGAVDRLQTSLSSCLSANNCHEREMTRCAFFTYGVPVVPDKPGFRLGICMGKLEIIGSAGAR